MKNDDMTCLERFLHNIAKYALHLILTHGIMFQTGGDWTKYASKPSTHSLRMKTKVLVQPQFLLSGKGKFPFYVSKLCMWLLNHSNSSKNHLELFTWFLAHIHIGWLVTKTRCIVLLVWAILTLWSPCKIYNRKIAWTTLIIVLET